MIMIMMDDEVNSPSTSPRKRRNSTNDLASPPAPSSRRTRTRRRGEGEDDFYARAVAEAAAAQIDTGIALAEAVDALAEEEEVSDEF